MISVETQSRLAGHRIVERALRPFGPEGLDVEIAGRFERSAQFMGCAGFVSVNLELETDGERTQVEAAGPLKGDRYEKRQ